LDLRGRLLDALRVALDGTSFQCDEYNRATKVRWIEIWNTKSDHLYWYVGIDRDGGLSLQSYAAQQAWSDAGVVEELVTEAECEISSVAADMRALIWAGYDPANGWVRIGPPLFSVSEGTSCFLRALEEGEALLRRMHSIQSYLQGS